MSGLALSKKYQTKITEILSDLQPRLATTHSLEFKNCFGAIAGYVNGQIFVSCGKFGLALRLPPRMLKRLLNEQGAKPLKYFKNGHIKKGYAVLPRSILEDREQLKKLVDASIRFAAN